MYRLTGTAVKAVLPTTFCRESSRHFVPKSCTGQLSSFQITKSPISRLRYASTITSASSTPSKSSADVQVKPTAKAVGKKLRQDRSSVVRPAAQPDGQAIAFSVAQSFNIERLTRSLAARNLVGRTDDYDAVNLMGEAIWIPKWPLPEQSANPAGGRLPPGGTSAENTNAGEIFVFETGSFVTWGVSEGDALDFRNQVLRAPGHPGIEVESYTADMEKEDWTERMPYFVREGERTGVKNDVVIIGTKGAHRTLSTDDAPTASLEGEYHTPLLTPIEIRARPTNSQVNLQQTSAPATSPITIGSVRSSEETTTPSQSRVSDSHSMPRGTALPAGDDDLRSRLALSSGLARSTKLSIYEEMLENYMDRVKEVPAQLVLGSSRSLKRKTIIQNTGRFLQLRQYINLNEENLLDPPEMFWAHSGFEKCYDEMVHALEVKSRLINLNQKIDYNLDMQDALRELENSSASHRLEWIIIILIAVEVVLGLVREGYWPFRPSVENERRIE